MQGENITNKTSLEENYNTEEYVSGEEYREEMKALTPKKQDEISWKQKLAAVFLIIFGLSAFILWIIQFRSGLNVAEPLTQEEIASMEQSREETNTDALRAQDTDQDGLSDYDEFYFYDTSPYLEDTDSDGLWDKEEIESGEDPNCPLGQDCYSAEATVDSGSGTGQTQNDLELDTEAINNYLSESANSDTEVSDADLETQIIEEILSGNADATNLRILLKESGMDENMLNQISDEDLINTYKNTLSSNK
ncbi:MAG: hypothetical protein WC323_02505 [Patescibacteria group bacterium]|jgi:hypothetical protein